MRQLRNENGSTLLMTVITIAILTVLGTTVLSLTLMNVNMQYTDTMVKSNQYYSESGIEQVYSILGKYVDEALVHAKEETDEDIDAKKDLMRPVINKIENWQGDYSFQFDKYEEKKEEYELNNPLSVYPISYMQFIDRKLYITDYLSHLFSDPAYRDTLYVEYSDESQYYDGIFLKVLVGSNQNIDNMIQLRSNNFSQDQYYALVVDQEAMDRYYRERMNYHFKDYISQRFDSADSVIARAITFDNDSEDVLDQEGMELIDISFDYDNSTKFSLTKGDDTLIIKDLVSSFTYHDRTRKTIETDLVINAPTDLMPVKINQSKYATLDNPLCHYGLVTESVVTFESGASNVYGNVYALGTKPDPSEMRTITKNYDGVNVVGNGTRVTITGDVVSQSFVQMKSVNNASLTVKNGHVYCDSLATQAETMNNTITIDNGNVYTKNDLVLNGTGNEINIQGNYYGYTNRDDDFYNVSAIIINADIEDASKLTISGMTPMHVKGVVESFMVDGSWEDGIFIAGTSFVNDLFSPNPNDKNNTKTIDLYETGESMGIAGNYLAYAFPEVDGAGNSVMGEPATGQESGLQLYYKKNDTTLSVLEKAQYFIDNIKEDMIKDYISDGSGNIDINHESYLHTTGAVVGKDNDGSSFKTHNRLSSLSDVEEGLLRQHVALLNYLKYDHEIGLASIHGYDGDFETIINNMGQATVISNYSMIDSDNPSIDNTIEALDTRMAPSITGSGNAQEVAIFQGANSGENILLLGDNTSRSGETGDMISIGEKEYYLIRAIEGRMQGIILTNGEVRIEGDLDYKGSIIAKGDIELAGGDVEIVNQSTDVRNYLTRLIMESPKLSYALSPDSVNNEHFAKLGITLDQVEAIEELSLSVGDVNEMRKHYDEYIGFRNWRIVE